MQDPTNFSACQGGRLEDNVSSVLEDVVIWLNPPLRVLTALLAHDLGQIGFFWDMQRRGECEGKRCAGWPW